MEAVESAVEVQAPNGEGLFETTATGSKRTATAIDRLARKAAPSFRLPMWPRRVEMRFGGAETPGYLETVVVEVDHDELGRRVELRREQRRQANRTRAHDCHRRARLDFAVEHATLEAGGEDVAQHDQRFRVGF